MSDEALPKHWRSKTLGEVVEQIKTKRHPQDTPDDPYIGMDDIEPHTMRRVGRTVCAKYKSMGNGYEPGLVMYGRLRPYLNKVYVPDESGVCSGEFMLMRPSEEIDLGYLARILNSPAMVTFAGTLDAGDRPRVSFEQIRAFQVPLPPVEEQRAIVAAIELAFARVDAIEAEIDATERGLATLELAALRDAFSGRPPSNSSGTEADATQANPGDVAASRSWPMRPLGEVAQCDLGRMLDKAKNGAPGVRRRARPDAPGTQLCAGGRMSDWPYQLPAAWEWHQLSGFCTVTMGSSPKSATFTDGPDIVTPFLQGNAEFGDRHPAPRKGTTDPIRLAPAGSVLISVRAPVGAVNITQHEVCIGRGLAALTPERDEDLAFIYWVMQATRLRLQSRATGTTFPAVTGPALKSLPIPVPPADDRDAIVAAIEDAFARVDAIEAELCAVEREQKQFRAALLRDAFSGALTGSRTGADPAAA